MPVSEANRINRVFPEIVHDAVHVIYRKWNSFEPIEINCASNER
jgi:hypothetical protein